MDPHSIRTRTPPLPEDTAAGDVIKTVASVLLAAQNPYAPPIEESLAPFLPRLSPPLAAHIITTTAASPSCSSPTPSFPSITSFVVAFPPPSTTHPSPRNFYLLLLRSSTLSSDSASSTTSGRSFSHSSPLTAAVSSISTSYAMGCQDPYSTPP
ncbi:hypothetical protein ZIOFF_015301 [Zingiber officinale]|uniref:Uncharacterized protein n=1 Tax=Zingiber officinale TaxID=94328 RepID=A0A8J5LQ57_ZINOF|nr:hypothetical protein ZIOFF_015301 [Zingiber officinale]